MVRKISPVTYQMVMAPMMCASRIVTEQQAWALQLRAIIGGSRDAHTVAQNVNRARQFLRKAACPYHFEHGASAAQLLVDIHRWLFDGVDPQAGEIRTEDLAGVCAPVADVFEGLASIDSVCAELGSDGLSSGDQFEKSLAVGLAQLQTMCNFYRPFASGLDAARTLWLERIAASYGYGINWQLTDQRVLDSVSIQVLVGRGQSDVLDLELCYQRMLYPAELVDNGGRKIATVFDRGCAAAQRVLETATAFDEARSHSGDNEELVCGCAQHFVTDYSQFRKAFYALSFTVGDFMELPPTDEAAVYRWWMNHSDVLEKLGLGVGSRVVAEYAEAELAARQQWVTLPSPSSKIRGLVRELEEGTMFEDAARVVPDTSARGSLDSSIRKIWTKQ